MINLVLFGPPGAGKGTQAEFLVEKYGLKHISTGDVFRANMKDNTELGQKAKAFMEKGQLVPDELTIAMLEDVVEKCPQAKGFIFDGFPRTEAQGVALDKFLSKKGMAISAMLALEVADELLIERLLKRGEVSGRADDKDESIIRNRIKEYYEKTNILKNFYSKQNKYFGIDGVGSIEEITNRLYEVIDNKL